MKRIIFLFSLIGSTLNLQAQNLVINPSFESYSSCPAGPSEFDNATNWRNPFLNAVGDTCSTSDLYSSCSPFGSFGVGVPDNIMGSEAAHTGNAYAGIILYEGFSTFGCASLVGSNWREYAEGQFSSPLVAGQEYCVSFYVSLADNVKWSTDDIAVYLSSSEVSVSCNSVTNSVLQYTPQLEYAGPELDSWTGWTQLQWTYTATGGEQYIIIGNFKDDANTTYNCANQNAFNPYSYYYLDDVSVELGACSAPCSLELSVQSSQQDCIEGGTASVTATVSNGSGSYSYDWGAAGSGQTISSLGNGTYVVTVTDLNTAGCATTDSVTIDILQPIVAEAGSNDTICKGDFGQLTASGGATYSWDSGDQGPVLNISPGTTTAYTVTATGSNGCTDTDQASIVVYDVPTVLIETADMTLCDNAASVEIGAMPSGGNFIGPGMTGNMFDPAAAGIGVHTVYYQFGDFEDCLGIDSVQITVDLCTGIDPPDPLSSVHIYPNPSHGMLAVESDGNESLPVKVELLNVLGQEMMAPVHGRLNKLRMTFDISYLSRGIYFVRISTITGQSNFKVVLQ